jgi:AraC-like DNA-binding protein
MIHTVVVSLPSLITLFWAATLTFDRQKDNRARRFLPVFMLVGFLLYICYIPFFNGQIQRFIYLLPLYTMASLLVFPMYHHYICLVTRYPKYQPRFLLHYIPAFLYFVALGVGVLMLSERDLALIEQAVAKNHFAELLLSSGMASFVAILFVTSRMVFAILVVVTLYLNVRCIKVYNVSIRDFFSNPESRNINNLSFILFALSVTSILSIIFNAIGFQFFQHNDWLLIIPSGILSSMLYLVGFVGNRQAQVCLDVECNDDDSQETYQADGIDVADEPFVQKFDECFFGQKLYLQKDLKIWDVCDAIDTNRTYISSYINKSFGLNFCSFVNQKRVEHAMMLLSDEVNDIYSLNYIAEESGFSSMNSFYRAFAKEYGMSPGKLRQTRSLSAVLEESDVAS